MHMTFFGLSVIQVEIIITKKMRIVSKLINQTCNIKTIVKIHQIDDELTGKDTY